MRWLIGIILGEIICESSNWQHIQRLKITILGANWQLFGLERIAKCSYFILSTQNIKFYWFVMKINFCCQYDDTIEVYFLLGIIFWGLRSEWVKFYSCKKKSFLPIKWNLWSLFGGVFCINIAFKELSNKSACNIHPGMKSIEYMLKFSFLRM